MTRNDIATISAFLGADNFCPPYRYDPQRQIDTLLLKGRGEAADATDLRFRSGAPT